MNIGDKVKLVDAKGLGKYGLRRGDVGSVNSLTVVADEEYAMFSPENDTRFYWIQQARLEVVEEDDAEQ